MRQRRALLSIVVNAQQGNSIALSSNDDEPFSEVSMKQNSSSTSSPLGLYNCGVAGCRCEHFTVSDVNKAKNEGYGVCTHCNHGAMYHHHQQMSNKPDSSKNLIRQNIKNKNNVKVDNNDHHNSNMTSLVASAAQSVSPLPVPLNAANNNNTHHHQHLPGSSSSSSLVYSHQQMMNQPISSSNLVTPYSSTRTSLGGTAKQEQQQDQRQQHQFSSAARMSLTNILSLVDSLERSAVLKTMKCEEEEESSTTTTALSSTNHAQSRATKCSLLSQALTNLVRACDIVNERIAFLKRLADHNTENANFSPETCLNERNTLSRRFEQLTQHCTRVKSLLSSVEKSIATSIQKTDNNTNKNVFLLDQSQYQHHQQQQTTQTQRAPSFSDENMMMHGPVEFHFDQQQRRTSVSPVNATMNNRNNTDNIKSSTRSDSISSSFCCDINTKPSVTTTSSSHQLSETLRLCKDCLETTLASSLFCHNCGKPSTTTIAQIRAPSPDPVYE